MHPFALGQQTEKNEALTLKGLFLNCSIGTAADALDDNLPQGYGPSALGRLLSQAIRGYLRNWGIHLFRGHIAPVFGCKGPPEGSFGRE